MQPQVAPSVDNQTQAQLPKVDAHVTNHVITTTMSQVVSQDDRAVFYTGQDRLSLQRANVQRVRELHEANDQLQRQIMKNEKDLLSSSDPLTILAEIEHCNIIIARNTGEILNIYSQNEARLKRIKELEALNLDLQQEMSDMQGKFITTHDMHQRTTCAAAYFLSKATYEKNLIEIRELSQE